ncbi:AraC family transcriptional regulator [Lysinibacillus sphaericus CBAM5]|uniref:Methylphosphotriester-DNA alkyltransferase n=3 Tax=Lysinibacillus TaxID=400634 RepID=B1HU29_LYSSC|nr:methylphosphotriester-DNA alkyltransferase [Lysinibacillus sphaericus C3-41]EWH33671.1 AraC family transcriptional regulator [Lysinibacillus sphaericus CBAM5]
MNVEFFQSIQEVEAAGYRACKRCQPEIECSPQTQLIQQVTSFIINAYKQKVTLQDMADHVGISPFYLERLFKQVKAETPRAYLEKIRIDKAAHLLKHTDYTSLEICYEAGFQSPSNFYKVFRRLKNCSPTEYRNL